jgi:hypothetical protein
MVVLEFMFDLINWEIVSAVAAGTSLTAALSCTFHIK